MNESLPKVLRRIAKRNHISMGELEKLILEGPQGAPAGGFANENNRQLQF